jgi:hypothetical protein
MSTIEDVLFAVTTGQLHCLSSHSSLCRSNHMFVDVPPETGLNCGAKDYAPGTQKRAVFVTSAQAAANDRLHLTFQRTRDVR